MNFWYSNCFIAGVFFAMTGTYVDESSLRFDIGAQGLKDRGSISTGDDDFHPSGKFTPQPLQFTWTTSD